MGRFKQAITAIKGQLTDLGGQYLGETGGAISRLQGIISKVISRLNYVLQDFDVNGKMGNFLDAVDKGADKLIVLMTKYLGTTPSIFGFFKESFMTIGNAFDRMQDWMRQFQAAGELINEYFFKPLFSSIGSSFTTSMTSLAETIEKNKGSIQAFAEQIASTLIAIGKYGDVVRRLFIGAMPALQMLLKVVELFFKGLAGFGKAALGIANALKSIGLGKISGVVNLVALYALFSIAKKFFTVLGTMFGKNIPSMNVNAGVVNINGSPMSTATDLIDGPDGGKGGKLKKFKDLFKGGGKGKIAGKLAQGAGKIAAPLAIATGAYLAGSKISSKFNDDSVKSRGTSAGASALAGAGIGAAIGSFVPVIGTGIGAAIGAAVGGLTGYFKAGKQRKNTRKAAEAMVEDYGKNIDEAIAGGNVDDLINMRDQLKIDRAKFVNTNADPAYAAQALKKYDEEFNKLNTSILNYTTAVGISDKYFGIGAESLNKLAEAAGIDLKAQMLNFRDVLDLVGKTAEEKARLIKVAWSNIGAFAVSEAMSYFDKKAQAKEQGKQLNATQARILTGDVSNATSDQYLKQMLDYNVSKFGDVGGITNAFVGLEKQLTTGSLKNISEEQKTYMRNELINAGATPEALLKNIDSTELATLVGGNEALSGFKKEDGTIDSTKLVTMLKGRLTSDPEFLANFIEAQQSADASVAAYQTNALLTTGAVPTAMVGAGGSMSPAERNARGLPSVYTPPSATTSSPSYVNTTINASVLDRGTIQQIEAAIAKAIREQKERGAVAPVKIS
jgi:hypothetical protein